MDLPWRESSAAVSWPLAAAMKLILERDLFPLVGFTSSGR
jgi:hypothetical protein